MLLRTICSLIYVCAAFAPFCFSQSGPEQPTERERALLERIARLEQRLSALEKKSGPDSVVAPAASPGEASGLNADSNETPQQPAPDQAAALDWLRDMTVRAHFDGYYLWNTNRPLGRINLLRAYDVTANSFSLNQTGVIFEKPVNVDTGRRWGYRLDLMYGQATEAGQGGAQNEPRPQAYRAVFQAFGTYVFPVGNGLTMDFGKWASPLGFEGNYTKDQINYSRGYFFTFLPSYHMGFRNTYKVSDQLSVAYHLVNGANQTEDFNEFKSQHVQLAVKPTSTSAWTVNYYTGPEQRDLIPALNPGIPTIPTQPGLSTSALRPAPDGRFHVIDTYATITPTEKLTLVGELDYVINRVENNSAPQRIMGGAAYLKYQFTPKFHFGQRYTRLNDKAGLFSGVSQNLNDLTSTVAYRPTDGFEARLEYRRDFSNVPFFLTSDPNRLDKAQDTFTLGLLWWFGGKQGSW